MPLYKGYWYTVRSDGSDGVISTADSDLADDGKTWENLRDNLQDESYEVPKEAGQIELAFTCKNADTDTFTAVVYAAREGGDIEYVCTATGTSGAQETGASTPRYYCDTLASTSDRWASDVFYIDADDNDGMSKIVFDLRERKWVIVLFTSISTGDNVKALISWA